MKRALLCVLLFWPAAGMAAPAAPVTMSVAEPWFRYLLPDLPAALYLTLHNSGDQPAVLVGASSPGCGMLMLHRSVQNGGTSSMVMVRSVTVPAHGSFAFTPDAYHIMCMQPVMKLGASVPVMLDFKDGGTLMLTVPVFGPAGPPAP